MRTEKNNMEHSVVGVWGKCQFTVKMQRGNEKFIYSIRAGKRGHGEEK